MYLLFVLLFKKIEIEIMQVIIFQFIIINQIKSEMLLSLEQFKSEVPPACFCHLLVTCCQTPD